MSVKSTRYPVPPVVSREEWQAARDALMTKEKALTRAKDALSAERRRLPMVKVEANYRFDGPGGEVSFVDLFEGRRQLIVQHFMFHPDWDAGCPHCTFSVENIGIIGRLHETDIAFALVGRAPLEKPAGVSRTQGLGFPLVSLRRHDVQPGLRGDRRGRHGNPRDQRLPARRRWQCLPDLRNRRAWGRTPDWRFWIPRHDALRTPARVGGFAGRLAANVEEWTGPPG